MHIKKLFKTGNSWCLVLPRDVLRALRPAPDNHVVLRATPEGTVTLESLDTFLAKRTRPADPRPRAR